MNNAGHKDVEIFTEAVPLPAGDRSAFLERVCAGDAGLRQQVEGLLKAHDQLAGFLDQLPDPTLEDSDLEAAGLGEKPDDRVGRFKLLQPIGEGGGGVVWMAEQEEPVRRRVALKIIKPGMDSKNVIARFEAERQALAMMDHPNIAKIFEAGATDSGRPYFAMELVCGVKITEYCDQHSLTTEERLTLFAQVCQAVQHAHQKGIIHRDIKPSNILVTTSSEGQALPVIIDFGIAKATSNQRLTDKTIFTALEMFIGTPAYMSPEQAALTSTDVDTRSDIYSLGVLLYELLTGATPFDAAELLAAGLDEIRRVVREQEPACPSTRLKRMKASDLTTLAQRRQSAPPQLIRAIHGDLDWIVMKALEKDRVRRYQTAHGMALDVQHFLAKEPILARPPSTLYKFQKTFLRNQLLFTGLGIIALVLVVSLVIVTALLARERQALGLADAARRQAEADRADAQSASVKSQQATKFLEDMLRGVGPSVARGRDTTLLREILDQTADRIGQEMTNQPAVEAELRALIGKLYEEIGNYGRAEEMERAALAIRRTQFGPESPEAADSLNDLGVELMAQYKLSAAEQADAEALAIRRRHLGNENADTATSLNDLGAVYREEGKLAGAEAMAREALGIRRTLLGNEKLEVADSLRNLCIILGDEGKWAEAEALAREVLAMRQKLLGPEHPWVASALDDLAWAATGAGHLPEAQAMYEAALQMRRKLLGDTHPEVARTLNSLGLLLARQGNLTESHAVLQAVVSIQNKLLGEDNPDTLNTLSGLGGVLAAEGKWPEAEAVWRQALTARRKLGGSDDLPVLYALRGLGAALEGEGKWPEAEAVWRESLASWRQRGGIEEQQSMYTLRKLGLALETEGKWPEAEARFREALAVSSKKPDGQEDPEALADLDRLTRVLIDQEKFGESETLLGEVLTPAFIREPASADLLIRRVDLRGRQGRWTEAAADAALALEYQPAEHYRYHTLASLLAINGDRPAYLQLCQRLSAQFPNPTNPYVAERVAQDCLLEPDAPVDLHWVDRLADTAVSAGSGEVEYPYFQACKAMACYRLGYYPEAIAWATKATLSSLPDARAKAYAVSAMAHWQLGQKEAARSLLTKGDALAPRLPPKDNSVNLGDLWVAWLQARISLAEAASLIQPAHS